MEVPEAVGWRLRADPGCCRDHKSVSLCLMVLGFLIRENTVVLESDSHKQLLSTGCQLPELRQPPSMGFPLGFSRRVSVGQEFESVGTCGSCIMLPFLGWVQKPLEAGISGSWIPGSSPSHSQPRSHASARMCD